MLEKALAGGRRVVVVAGSAERVATLDAALWIFDDRSFLPHGSARDGDGAEQPIWLTTREENPNRAGMLVLVDGVAAADFAAWPEVCEFFDGRDESAVAAARARWKAAKDAGHALHYFRQTESGGWEQAG